MQKSIKDFQQESGVTAEVASQQIMDMIGGIPLGRTGKPEEMAEFVASLASDRGAFASGSDYILDGSQKADRLRLWFAKILSAHEINRLSVRPQAPIWYEHGPCSASGWVWSCAAFVPVEGSSPRTWHSGSS